MPSKGPKRKFNTIRLTKNSVGNQFLRFLDDEPRENTLYFNVFANRYFNFNNGVEIECILHIHDLNLNQVYCFSQIIENDELYIFKYRLPKASLPTNVYNGDLIKVSGQTYLIGTYYSDFDNEGVQLRNVSVNHIQNNVAKYYRWAGMGTTGPSGVSKARSYSALKRDYSRNKGYIMSIFVRP